MDNMRTDSREIIKRLIEKEDNYRIPWTLDFGACKGILWSVAEKYKKLMGFNFSLAKYFDYDIWMTLDPDRVYNDKLSYLSDSFVKKISKESLIGGIPLSKHDDYDYLQHYKTLPDDGFFDGFGLYYYPWSGNPGYYDFLSPLENTNDLKRLQEYPVPILREDDLEFFKKDIYFIKTKNKMCSAYSGSFYEWSYYLRGREKIYLDYYDNPGIVKLITRKVANFVEYLTKTNVDCGVDILCFYDDLGSQNGLQISPSIFRKFYKPYYKKVWGMIKENYNDKYIFLHSCGDISEIIPDLIECGLDILHPIQPETMNVYKITKEYSKYLIFWGTMSNQHTFPNGNRKDIFNEVKERITRIGKDARLILGSSNTLGTDVPVENINYFRDACKRYCSIR